MTTGHIAFALFVIGVVIIGLLIAALVKYLRS